jgi:hypothetical protein
MGAEQLPLLPAQQDESAFFPFIKLNSHLSIREKKYGQRRAEDIFSGRFSS